MKKFFIIMSALMLSIACGSDSDSDEEIVDVIDDEVVPVSYTHLTLPTKA